MREELTQPTSPKQFDEKMKTMQGAVSRKWTDNRGSVVSASLAELGDIHVALRQLNGKTLKIRRDVLHATDQAYLKKCEEILFAIDQARENDNAEDAITTLGAIISAYPGMPNIGVAQGLRDNLASDIEFEKEQRAKGLVKVGDTWMTPQQAEDAEFQNYLSSNYGRSVKLFETEDAASVASIDFNRSQQSYVEARKAKVNLWLEYGMAGAPHPGPEVTFQMAKVAYDRQLGCWVMYLVDFARF